jgi:hypothetical protein
MRQLHVKLEELEHNEASLLAPNSPVRRAPRAHVANSTATDLARTFRHMLSILRSRECAGDRVNMLQTMRLTDVASIAEGRHGFLRDDSVAEDFV